MGDSARRLNVATGTDGVAVVCCQTEAILSVTTLKQDDIWARLILVGDEACSFNDSYAYGYVLIMLAYRVKIEGKGVVIKVCPTHRKDRKRDVALWRYIVELLDSRVVRRLPETMRKVTRAILSYKDRANDIRKPRNNQASTSIIILHFIVSGQERVNKINTRFNSTRNV